MDISEDKWLNMSIIKVENLSKKYIIGHDRNAGNACNYKSFRETLAHSTRGFYQRLRHPFSPNKENTELEEFWALKDINFEIKQGERVGIIGRNGAGKSTLLKILSRITEPTTGKITINGRVASLLEVGTGFHPELTGRENIFLNGAVLGMSRMEIKKKFDEIVDFSGVKKFLDTPVKRYSSGMYVRLAFSVAAHLEPEILLVDEVLAVGDTDFQKKCLGKMEDISKEGRTVLFVSHNMVSISLICSKGIFLENGILNFEGNINYSIKHYLNSNKEINNVWENSFINTNYKEAELKRVEIYSKKNTKNAIFTHREELNIAIYYSIKTKLKNFRNYLRIYDENNQVIFGSGDWDIDLTNQIHEPGNYIAICKVPNHFLNTGKYYLQVEGTNPRTIYYYKYNQTIFWEISDEFGAGNPISHDRPGFMRPILKWEIKKLFA